MSLGTYAALKTSLASWATRDSLTAQLPDFVAWAHQEICRRLRAPVLYARADVTVNAETVTAPTGFLAAKRFYLNVSRRRVLHLVDSGQLIDMTANSASSDYPTCFAIEGTDTLAFAPLFTSSATGKLLYYKAPTALVNDTDTNVVLTKYPFLYLYGALEALYRYLEDDNNTDRYGAQFGALIGSINETEAADSMRGPLAISPGGSVV